MYVANMNVPKEYHKEFVSSMMEDDHDIYNDIPGLSPVSLPTMSFSDYAMDDEDCDSDMSSISELEEDDRNHDESEQLEDAAPSESAAELEQSLSGDTETSKRTVESESDLSFSECSNFTAVLKDENNNICNDELRFSMFGPNFINIDGDLYFARIRIGGNEHEDLDKQFTTANNESSFVPLQLVLDSLFTKGKERQNLDRYKSLHSILTVNTTEELRWTPGDPSAREDNRDINAKMMMTTEEVKPLPDHSQATEEVNKSSADEPPNITSVRVPQNGEPVPQLSTASLESNSGEPVAILGARTFLENPVARPSKTNSVPVKYGTQRTSKSMRRKKRLRTAFTTSQLENLEAEYSKCHYIDRPTRINLANALSLNEKAIKVWYQNRRMKDKRDSDGELDKDMYNIENITPPLNENQPSISGYNLKSTDSR